MIDQAGKLHVNYDFCLMMAQKRSGRILDYGCGAGHTVREGLRRGLDIWGSDVFYEGKSCREDASDLLGERILEMKQSRLPFADASIDFVFHNQVFEHVPDLNLALSEIRRVLKPAGRMLSLFPSREVLWDGHCRIFQAHRWKRFPLLRQCLIFSQRAAGMGANKEGETCWEYAAKWRLWIDDWCYYRPLKEIRAAYLAHGFSFDSHENEYIDFRLKHKYRIMSSRAATWAFRRAVGLVILSKADMS